MIKLLSEIPEVGKVPKHVEDAMFASEGQIGVAFACSLAVSVCVRRIPRLQTRSPFLGSSQLPAGTR